MSKNNQSTYEQERRNQRIFDLLMAMMRGYYSSPLDVEIKSHDELGKVAAYYVNSRASDDEQIWSPESKFLDHLANLCVELRAYDQIFYRSHGNLIAGWVSCAELVDRGFMPHRNWDATQPSDISEWSEILNNELAQYYGNDFEVPYCKQVLADNWKYTPSSQRSKLRIFEDHRVNVEAVNKQLHDALASAYGLEF